MHFAQGRCDQLDVGILLDHAIDQREERVGIELRFGGHFRPGNAQPFLQVFFIADERIELAGDSLHDLLAALGAPDRRPEFGAIVRGRTM